MEMRRTLVFQNPGSLSLHNGQLVYNRPDGEPERVPVEDIGIVIAENSQLSFTEPLIAHRADNNVILVCCDAAHCPVSVSMPLKGHCAQGKIVRCQLSTDRKVKDELWKEIVRRKIQSEKSFLHECGLPFERLEDILLGFDEIETPQDATSMEAVAAKYYFDELYGKQFHRDRYGKTPNDYLNYGYTVLRAVVIRELIASGLFLGEGLYHHNRANEFPLADDVIEPYRVFVDRIVYELLKREDMDLNSRTRQELIKVVSAETRIKGFRHSLSDAIRMTAGSLMKIFTGEAEISDLVYPDFG